MTITGTAAQINAALAGLTYTGNLNFNGPDTLTVTTGDGTAQDIDTVAITVNAVNDAPVNTVPGAQSVNEDTTLPIAGVSVADVGRRHAHHHADGDQRHAQCDRGWWRNDQRQRHRHGGDHRHGRADQRGAGRASPTPATSTSTAPTRSPSPPATAPLQDIDTVAITVNPLDDAPVNTVPGAQSVNEDTTLAIAGVSVADPDVGHAHHHADGDAAARSA